MFNLQQQVLTRKQLQDLAKEVDPNEQLDDDVEDVLLSYADDFMQDLIEGACTLAAHRKSNIVEPKDVQTHLGISCLKSNLFLTAKKGRCINLLLVYAFYREVPQRLAPRFRNG